MATMVFRGRIAFFVDFAALLIDGRTDGPSCRDARTHLEITTQTHTQAHARTRTHTLHAFERVQSLRCHKNKQKPGQRDRERGVPLQARVGRAVGQSAFLK